MANTSHSQLTRRERQIMDIVYRRGRATAAEVLAELPDPPSYSAVRTLLRIREEKGSLRHQQEGPRYVFLPTLARDKARRSALKQMVQTFFDGSAEQAGGGAGSTFFIGTIVALGFYIVALILTRSHVSMRAS